jgi:hypothetical protein
MMWKEIFRSFLALFWSIMFGAVITLWMLRPPTGTEGTMAMLNALLGSLVTITVGAVGYYFGSSSGSQQKDDTISAMAAAPLPGGAGSVTVTTATPNQAGTTVVSSEKTNPVLVKDKP